MRLMCRIVRHKPVRMRSCAHSVPSDRDDVRHDRLPLFCEWSTSTHLTTVRYTPHVPETANRKNPRRTSPPAHALGSFACKVAPALPESLRPCSFARFPTIPTDTTPDAHQILRIRFGTCVPLSRIVLRSGHDFVRAVGRHGHTSCSSQSSSAPPALWRRSPRPAPSPL